MIGWILDFLLTSPSVFKLIFFSCPLARLMVVFSLPSSCILMSVTAAIRTDTFTFVGDSVIVSLLDGEYQDRGPVVDGYDNRFQEVTTWTFACCYERCCCWSCGELLLCFESHVDSTSKSKELFRKMNSWDRGFIDFVLSYCIIAWFGNVNLLRRTCWGALVPKD